jgi:hypothetical protein
LAPRELTNGFVAITDDPSRTRSERNGRPSPTMWVIFATGLVLEAW